MATIDLTKQQVVDTLADFEDKLPFLGTKMYEPSANFNSLSLDSLFVEASRILQFMGLNMITPRISFTDLKDEHAAGQAIMGNVGDKNWYIVIDRESARDKDCALRVLAHEICHKVVELFGLHTQNQFMTNLNEVRTELCTIYMGLGLLVLNGYREHCGYLNLEDFCHAFCVVYKTRGMSDTELVRLVPEHCKDYVTTILLEMAGLQAKNLSELVIASQKSDYKLRRMIRTLQLMLDSMPEIREKHLSQDGMFTNRQEQLKDGWHPILEMLLRETIVQNTLEDSRVDDCCKEIERFIDKLCSVAKIDIDKVSKELTKNVTCPACGHVDEKKIVEGLKVLKCPQCHHHFVWDGQPLVLSHHTEKESKVAFWKRLFK